MENTNKLPTAEGSPERLVGLCRSFDDHNFGEVGRHRVPCHGSYYQGMPLEPDGTIESIDFKCRLCGSDYSEARNYSWQPND